MSPLSTKTSAPPTVSSGRTLVSPILGMQKGRPRRHCVNVVENEGQDFPVDLDQPQGLLRDLLALGCDDGANLVADPSSMGPQDTSVTEASPHHAFVGKGVHTIGPACVRRFQAGDIRDLRR